MRETAKLGVERLEERCMLSGLSLPALTSRPGASLKMYIDFDGDIGRRFGSWAGIGGTDTNGPIPAYDIDGDVLNFSTQELENIRQIHQIVAEKFSPFDIDITTVDPGSLDDDRAGKIVVGGNGMWYGGSAGGVAQHGGLWGPSENVGYVWNAPANVRYVGEAVAHEAGHMLGLAHQSNVNAGIVTTEYRRGPIMGRGDLDIPGGRWIFGDATGRDWFDDSLDRRGLQDDIPVLTGRGLSLRADDHGNTRTSATPMLATSVGFTASGVIEQESDGDFFQFGSILPGTSFTVRVDVDSLAPMLDPRIELYDASGTLVAEAQTSEYAESIEVASATSSVYYVAIRPGGNAGVAYNIGSYGVVMERTEDDDNTPSTATKIFGVQGIAGGFRAFGEHVITDFVSDSDEFDWYFLELPTVALGGGSFFVGLGNLSSNVDLFVLRDLDRMYGVEIGTADVIGSSENGGTANESILVEAFSNTTVYVAVRHIEGLGTGYTLTLNIDRSDPGTAIPLTDEGTGTRTDYDHIGFGDIDSYHGHLSWTTGSSSSIVAVDFEFEPYDAAAELVIGADVNRNRILEPGEVSSSHVAAAGTVLDLNNVRARDDDRNPLLVEVRQFGSGRTNYRLENRTDRMPVFDEQLATAGAPLYDLGDSRHGGRIIDLLHENDDTDVVRLGRPAPGVLDIRVQQSPIGGAKFALIADFNQNGKIDEDELQAEGNKIFAQINEDDLTPYYLVATYDPGFVKVATYEVIYRDGLVTDPAGDSIQNPRQLIAEQGSVAGYVAFAPDVPPLDRPTVYYQLDVPQAGTLQAKLKLDNNGGGQGLLDAGLIVIRDFNQDGQVDPDERLAGFASGRSPALAVNVESGSYFIGVVARRSVGAELAEPTRYIDYRLDYFIDAVADVTPVEVLSAQFSPEDWGVFVKFTEDVEMTLGADDVSLELLAGNTSTVVPFVGQNYDSELKTVFVAMDPSSPDGNYRLQVRADGVADSAGNRQAEDFDYEFVIDLLADSSFDPQSGSLTIEGSEQDDELALTVAESLSIVIIHNGQELIPIDTTTGLPCTQGGICPTTTNLNGWTARLGSGDDVLLVTDANFESIDGGGGSNTLQIMQDGIVFDLRGMGDGVLVNIDEIDISAGIGSSVVLDLAKVRDITSSENTLVVRSNSDDAIDVGPGWIFQNTEFDDGEFYVVAAQQGAVLRLSGPHDWQNPLDRLDVHPDSVISPRDVLLVINELNRTNNSELPALAPDGFFPAPFLDVNGDGSLAPGDALLVINFLNRSEGEDANTVQGQHFFHHRNEWTDDFVTAAYRTRNVNIPSSLPSVDFNSFETEDLQTRIEIGFTPDHYDPFTNNRSLNSRRLTESIADFLGEYDLTNEFLSDDLLDLLAV